MRPIPIIFGLVLLVYLGAGSGAGAAETNHGKQLYAQYCSSCHGVDGRGNGPVARDLKVKVPNLILLRKNNKGIYPTDRVMSAIDGRRAIRGHGDRNMPVWGEIFRKEADDAKYPELTTLLKAKLIAEYIATLQQ